VNGLTVRYLEGDSRLAQDNWSVDKGIENRVSGLIDKVRNTNFLKITFFWNVTWYSSVGGHQRPCPQFECSRFMPRVGSRLDNQVACSHVIL
jgi:hypothetical protein